MRLRPLKAQIPDPKSRRNPNEGLGLGVWGLGFGILATLASLVTILDAQRGEGDTEWHGNATWTRYSPLSQIDKDNVGRLQVAWRWATPDRQLQVDNPALLGSRHEDSPWMVNGVLYTVTPLGFLAALDPGTGATKWVYDPVGYKNGKPNNDGYIHRGLAYWSDGREERLFLGTGDAYLVSVDAKTGKLDLTFGDKGRVDLTVGIPGAIRAINFTPRRPLVAGDVVILGNSILDPALKKQWPPGYVQAYDVRTGKQRWVFHTVPQVGEVGYETWLNDSASYSGNANVWSNMSYDAELGYVYLPISSATSDYYGGARHGDNLFSETLVCVEAKTGKRVWHFQTTHHGLWDYDLPAAPVLGDITVDGKRIKAVMQVSKQGFTYVLDRTNGRPVWPIVEREVPQSTTPGERSSKTQPFPTKPPAFETQGSIEANLIDFTPELRTQAIENLKQFESGPVFTPPSLKGTLVVPGVYGGANWGGAGFDPETETLYIPSRMTPSIMKLVPTNPAQTDIPYRMTGDPELAKVLTIQGLPIIKPPYARVTAVNMKKGENAWVKALGNGPRRHPLLKHLNLPPLGDGVHGATPLVTKTLLFIGATRLMFNGRNAPASFAEWHDADADRQMLYAFDKATGAVVREIELEGMSVGPPISYMHQGKQYLVMASGAGITSEIIALALP